MATEVLQDMNADIKAHTSEPTSKISQTSVDSTTSHSPAAVNSDTSSSDSTQPDSNTAKGTTLENSNTASSNINGSNGTTPTSPTTESIGTQIQNAFTPVTQAFARLSTFASESSLVNTFSSLKSSGSTTSNVNNGPFWKRKGKVPGTVKPVKGPFPPRTEGKPNGFMARPPTPPRSEPTESASELPAHDIANSPVSIPSPTPASPESPYSATHSNGSPDIHREPEYEHHCRAFGSCGTANERTTRLSKFRRILKNPIVDLEALKKLSWKGIPNEVRPTTWKLLLGYLPANVERREATLERKRKEYLDCIPQHFNVNDEERTEYERKIFRQIHIDVPRTNPNVPLFQQQIMQDILERILYIWAIRHPASGYVQGINDLATPFLVVFLAEIVGPEFETCDISTINPALLSLMEADSFWCMSKLLDGIQDHYTFAQPGIQRMTFKLKELVGRIDVPLARHLEEQGAQYIVFAFRWMNCLLMREMPLPIVVRMWDTYLSEGPAEGFSVFHVYVCAAFLVMWSEELLQRDFQDIILFLQHLPTTNWQCKDIEMLVSQAYLWMTIFQNAQSHLKS
jgi:hypothetical protein